MVFEVKCSWCGKHIGIKECPDDGVTLSMEVALLKISHGICHECKEEVMKSIETTINSINRKGKIE